MLDVPRDDEMLPYVISTDSKSIILSQLEEVLFPHAYRKYPIYLVELNYILLTIDLHCETRSHLVCQA